MATIPLHQQQSRLAKKSSSSNTPLPWETPSVSKEKKNTANTPDLRPASNTEIDNPHALRKFFDLMLSVLRVVNSVVVVRGPQNEQCRQQARDFIADNRMSIVAVFKRAARKGGPGEQATGAELEELVDNLCLLMTATDFLEVSLLLR